MISSSSFLSKSPKHQSTIRDVVGAKSLVAMLLLAAGSVVLLPAEGSSIKANPLGRVIFILAGSILQFSLQEVSDPNRLNRTPTHTFRSRTPAVSCYSSTKFSNGPTVVPHYLSYASMRKFHAAIRNTLSTTALTQ